VLVIVARNCLLALVIFSVKGVVIPVRLQCAVGRQELAKYRNGNLCWAAKRKSCIWVAGCCIRSRMRLRVFWYLVAYSMSLVVTYCGLPHGVPKIRSPSVVHSPLQYLSMTYWSCCCSTGGNFGG